MRYSSCKLERGFFISMQARLQEGTLPPHRFQQLLDSRQISMHSSRIEIIGFKEGDLDHHIDPTLLCLRDDAFQGTNTVFC